MRILIVNHCHPDVPHVCATRGREFACALAARGHQVVLLTEAMADERLRSADDMAAAIARHDFAKPYSLPVVPRDHALIRRARKGCAPPIVGRAALALSWLTRGHVFPDWSDAAVDCLAVLGRTFRPEVAWGICGNTGAWAIARMAGCPWVLDLKDSWPHFLTAPLRSAVTRHFRDAAGATAFSHSYAAQVREWFRRDATVVYSGIPDAFLSDEPPAVVDGFTVTLTGSVYGRDALQLLAHGLVSWLQNDVSPADRHGVRFVYYGADPVVAEIAPGIERLCPVVLPGFRPLAELRAAHLAAGVNTYTKSDRGPFHHKLFELLSAGRPVLCVPGEDEEAQAIAAQTGGCLESGATVDEIRAALQRAWAARAQRSPLGGGLASYTWAAQAVHLEGVLVRAAERRR